MEKNVSRLLYAFSTVYIFSVLVEKFQKIKHEEWRTVYPARIEFADYGTLAVTWRNCGKRKRNAKLIAIATLDPRGFADENNLTIKV